MRIHQVSTICISTDNNDDDNIENGKMLFKRRQCKVNVNENLEPAALFVIDCTLARERERESGSSSARAQIWACISNLHIACGFWRWLLKKVVECYLIFFYFSSVCNQVL